MLSSIWRQARAAMEASVGAAAPWEGWERSSWLREDLNLPPVQGSEFLSPDSIRDRKLPRAPSF